MFKSRVEGMEQSFVGLSSNWKTDLIFELRTDPNLPVPDGMYVTKWEGTFPGIKADCYCPSSSSSRSSSTYHRGYQGRGCIGWDEGLYCTDIPSAASKKLDKWIDGQSLYLLRARGTNFMDTYKAMDSSGNCANGYHQCGDKNSKLKGMCVPNKFAGCPISDIRSQPAPGYTPIPFRSFTLYITSLPTMNPIADAIISEHHLCFSRGDYALTPGRTRYPPLLGSSDSCVADSSAREVSTYGEDDYLRMNSIDARKYYKWDVSNGYIYKLFAAPVMEWSPACYDEIPAMENRVVEMGDLRSSYKTLFVLLIISCVLITIGCCASIFSVLSFEESSHSDIPYYVGTAVLLLSFLIILPSMFIVFTKSIKIGNDFERLANKKCGNDIVNANFASMSDTYNSRIENWAKWWFWLLLIGFIVQLIAAIVVILMHRKDRHNNDSYSSNSRNYNQLQETTYNDHSAPRSPSPANNNFPVSPINQHNIPPYNPPPPLTHIQNQGYANTGVNSYSPYSQPKALRDYKNDRAW